jgi:hypothetical protein
MNLLFKIIPSLFLLLNLFPNTVKASSCNVNFNYGVVIDPAHIRIIKHTQTEVQINHQHQLFIHGREIPLTKEQQVFLDRYTSGIREQVPAIVAIATEGVDMGLKAVNKVIAGLTGENSASHQKFQGKLNELQWRIKSRFHQSAKSYYVAPQDFDNLDEIFKGEFEEEIEEIITDSLGTILMAVGEAMSTKGADEDNIELRFDTIGDKMESIGKDLELELGSSSQSLKSKAADFCQNLIELNKAETQMQSSIPQLLKFDLIESSHNEDD